MPRRVVVRATARVDLPVLGKPVNRECRSCAFIFQRSAEMQWSPAGCCVSEWRASPTVWKLPCHQPPPMMEKSRSTQRPMLVSVMNGSSAIATRAEHDADAVALERLAVAKPDRSHEDLLDGLNLRHSVPCRSHAVARSSTSGFRPSQNRLRKMLVSIGLLVSRLATCPRSTKFRCRA